MATAESLSLSDLYENDETAWLEAMAELVRLNRLDSLDYANLAEYLSDMAARDRREVRSRLVMLLMHVLKWEHQPEKRSPSWRTTVVTQRQDLAELAGRGVLRAHAKKVLADAYRNAVELAASETGLASGAFPAECPYTVEQLLAVELPS
jgi:Domain of unknown function DUF29